MPAKKKTVVTEEPTSLALAISVEGKIINSNFDSFKLMAEEMIEQISFDLVTDEDFEQADADAKRLKKFEEDLAQGKKDFLAQMDEVNALFEGVGQLENLSRSTRLELEKQIKAKKLAVREGIVRDALAAIPVSNQQFSTQIQEAMKNKSSLVKMQESVTIVVNRINAQIDANKAIFQEAKEEHGDAVAYGESAFIVLPVDAAKVEIERRIERHKAAIKEAELKKENERLRREQEEKDKAAAAAAVQPEPAPAHAPQPAPAQEESLFREPDPEPAKPAGLTQQEEAQAFIALARERFAPLKAAREKFTHKANIEAGERFALALGTAWAKFNEEVAQ